MARSVSHFPPIAKASNVVDLEISKLCADVDTYNPVDHVDVQVQVDGAPFNNHFTIPSDASVIAVDTPGNQYGVDFWLNDGKGNPVMVIFGQKVPPLVTIFGPGEWQLWRSSLCKSFQCSPLQHIKGHHFFLAE